MPCLLSAAGNDDDFVAVLLGGFVLEQLGAGRSQFFGLRGGAALAACSPSSGLEHLLRAGGVCGRAKSAEGLYFVMANDEHFASS